MKIYFKGHNSWNSESENHRPIDGSEGSEPEVGGHEEVPGEGGCRRTAHEPRDHLPTPGHLQPPARCYKPMFCQESPGIVIIKLKQNNNYCLSGEHQ